MKSFAFAIVALFGCNKKQYSNTVVAQNIFTRKFVTSFPAPFLKQK